MTFTPGNIPQELKDKRQWVNWKIVMKPDGPAKVPFQPDGQTAKPNDPTTWSDFEACLAALDPENGRRFKGIGFMFNGDYTGIDFDDCVDPATGEITDPNVARWVRHLDSYTEYSQSGRGLHVIVKAKIPGPGRRKGNVEMYDAGRYFCMTGRQFDDKTAIESRQDELVEPYRDVFGANDPAPISQLRTHGPEMRDDDVIQKARSAKDGDKFARLFDGDTSDYNGDDSRADMALCSLLRFWIGDDPVRIDSLFRCSRLMRSKWDRPTGDSTYGEMTIRKVIELGGEAYQGNNEVEEPQAAKKPLSELKFDRNVQHSLCLISEDRAGNEHVRPIPGQIATYLQEHYFDFITFRDNELVYYYDQESGLYLPGAESLIKEASETIIGDPLSTHSLQQIIAHIQRQTYVDRAKVDAIDLDHVAIGNGILNTRTRELDPFSPDRVYLSKLSCLHDANAPTDEVEAYMKSTFHEDDVPWLQEFYGWHLEPSMRYKKQAMLVGGGDNGKTVFENCLMSFYGPENVASISIQDMADDRYSTAELYQKTANIYDDLPSMRVRDSGQFKILSGDGRARAQEKYQKAFYFWNRAKGTYSANKLPGTRDLSLAFFVRWLIAKMPYTFVDATDLEGNPTELGPGEQHKIFGILERMTTPEMLSSWLNWFLDGLDRLRENDRFSSSQTQNDIRDIWLMQTDPISMFAKECIEKEIGTIIEKSVVYKEYQTWCQDNDVTAEKDGEFAKRLQTVIRTSPVRPRSGGKRLTCWEDIRLTGTGDSVATAESQQLLGNDDDVGSITSNSNSDPNETEPVTGFGQGGQGLNRTLSAGDVKVHNIEEVYGNSPDHPDQTAVRLSFVNTSIAEQVRSYLEQRAREGRTLQTYDELRLATLRDILARDRAMKLTTEEIRAAFDEVIRTDKELIERCIDFHGGRGVDT